MAKPNLLKIPVQKSAANPAMPRTRPIWSLRRSEIVWGYLFMIPFVVLVCVFTLYPILGSLRITLYNWNGLDNPTQFVGLRHFAEVAKDPYFWNAFKNTVVYTAVLVPVQLTLALLLALVLNNAKMRFRTFYRTVYFLPVVTSLAIGAIAVRLMLGRGGAQISELFGIDPPISPIASPQFALPSVILFGIWHSFGINLVYFLAALQTVPEKLYDAATRSVSIWCTFWRRCKPCRKNCTTPPKSMVPTAINACCTSRCPPFGHLPRSSYSLPYSAVCRCSSNPLY